MKSIDIDVLPPLRKAADLPALRRTLAHFGQLYGIGIKLFDINNDKIVDLVTTSRAHCGYLFSQAATRKMCTAIVQQVRTAPPCKADQTHSIDCFSGLRYRIRTLFHDGSPIAKLILGPYAPAHLDAPPESLKQIDANLDTDRLAGHLAAISRIEDALAVQILQSLGVAIEAMLGAYFRAAMISNAHIAGISGAFSDLSSANQDLAVANEKLRDLDRLKSNFVATVSHELKTPLTSIIGYSEMLLEGMAGDINEEQREYIGTVLDKGEILLTLIGQILELSTAESPDSRISLKETPIHDVLAKSMTDVIPMAKKRSITLEPSVAQNLDPILVDPDKTRRVFTNLISNAIKFSPQGGAVAVECSLKTTPPLGNRGLDVFEPERNTHLSIKVSDQGEGIPKDKRERIFEAFFQIDGGATREVGGTGLGLCIVRNLVHAHGGQVFVHEAKQGGACFEVLLPYVPPRNWVASVDGLAQDPNHSPAANSL